MVLVVLLGAICDVDSHPRCHHVPESVRAEYEAPVLPEVNVVDVHVRYRGHNELVVVGVVAPQVSWIRGTRITVVILLAFQVLICYYLLLTITN